jgi:hypothetical protein
MKLVQLGVWVWGGATVLLAVAFLSIVIAAGFYIEPNDDNYKFVDAPHWLSGLFFALKENGSLVAGILGFSGLAWAHFFKVSSRVE